MVLNISVMGFDLDGTLYQITPEIRRIQRGKIYENLSEYFEIPVERAKELFERYSQELGSHWGGANRIAREMGKPAPEKSFIQEALEQADFLDLIEKNVQLKEMLARMSKTKRLDLLTSARYDSSIKKLEKIGISPVLFTSFFCHENGSKSSGEIYLKWLAQTRLSPLQHLYVGDQQKSDVDIPKALGIKTCFVGSYENADFQIGNLLELEELFNHAD